MKNRKRILLWLSRLAFTIALICSHNLLHTESDKIFCNAVAMGGLMVVFGYYLPVRNITISLADSLLYSLRH